jgi:hypothetical protein
VVTRTRLNVTFVRALHVLLLCLLYRTVHKTSSALHAEVLLIEFVISVCLPWTRFKSETVWGFININITGRWNLTIFSPVEFSTDIPLVISSAKDLVALCKRCLRQKLLRRCISMSKMWLDGCYLRHLFVVLPIYYLQVKLTAWLYKESSDSVSFLNVDKFEVAVPKGSDIWRLAARYIVNCGGCRCLILIQFCW